MTNPTIDSIFKNYKTHRIGSHSDDWGGDSDRPCFCDLKQALEEYIANAETEVMKDAREVNAALEKKVMEAVGEDDPSDKVDEGDWIFCPNCDRILGDDSDYDSKCPCIYKNELRTELRTKITSIFNGGDK